MKMGKGKLLQELTQQEVRTILADWGCLTTGTGADRAILLEQEMRKRGMNSSTFRFPLAGSKKEITPPGKPKEVSTAQELGAQGLAAQGGRPATAPSFPDNLSGGLEDSGELPRDAPMERTTTGVIPKPVEIATTGAIPKPMEYDRRKYELRDDWERDLPRHTAREIDATEVLTQLLRALSGRPDKPSSPEWVQRELPTYSGEHWEDPKTFLRECEDVFDRHHVLRSNWAGQTGRQLNGKVERWWETRQYLKPDWSTFKRMVLEEFDSPTVEAEAIGKLYSDRMPADEDVETFLRRKHMMKVRLLKHGSEEAFIRQMTELLPDEIKPFLRIAFPKNYDDFVRLAGQCHKDVKAARGNEGPGALTQALMTIQQARDGADRAERHVTRADEESLRREDSRGARAQERRVTFALPNSITPSGEAQETQMGHCVAQPSRPPSPAMGQTRWGNRRPHQENKRKEEERLTLAGKEDPSSTAPKHMGLSPSILLTLPHNQDIEALIDTQATTSFVDGELFELTESQQPDDGEVQLGTTEAKAPVLGRGTLKFTIQDHPMAANVTGVPRLLRPLILGQDWMKDNHVVIDFPNQLVSVGAERRMELPWYQRSQRAGESSTTLEIPEGVIGNTLPGNAKQHLVEMLNEYRAALTGVGRTGTVKHVIHVKDGQAPIRTHQYPLSEQKRDIITEQVREMLREGWIEPSRSAWCSPVVLAKKKEGDWRFCVDYRKLNNAMVDDAYPMPNVQETLGRLRASHWFSIIDLKKGYWQVEMDNQSRSYTAFASPLGLHQFRVMPFGLKTSPRTFQRLMEIVLKGYLGRSVEVYLDDIVIHSQNLEDHLNHIKEVLRRLKAHGLTAGLEKCRFATHTLTVLGRIITPGRITQRAEQIRAITEFPTPQTKRQIKIFMGKCQWYGNFAERLATVAAPMTDLLNGKRRWKWAEEQETAFRRVKELVKNGPPLCQLDPNRELCLQTDASDAGMGAVLYHPEGEGRAVIEFASRKFRGAETRYATVEKEALAIVWAVHRFGWYLEGRKFTIVTDNVALTWLRDNSSRNPKVYRWMTSIMDHDFTTRHCPGQENVGPDALSRAPADEPGLPEAEEEFRIPVPPTVKLTEEPGRRLLYLRYEDWLRDLKEAQTLDAGCQALRRDVLKGRQGPGWGIKDGLVVKIKAEGTAVPFIPEGMIDDLIRLIHEEAGHPGREETIRQVGQKGHFARLVQRVKTYVRDCQTCIRAKAGKGMAGPVFQRLDMPPGQVWAVDLMGPYPRSRRGKTMLFVMTDVGSRWVEAFPINKPTTATLWKILNEEIFERYGIPEEVISDNGPQFTAKAWKEGLEKLGVKATYTPPYHPRANPTERRNQDIKKALRIEVLDKEHKNWDEHVPRILRQIRSRRNKALGSSPAEAFLGRPWRRAAEWADAPGGEGPRWAIGPNRSTSGAQGENTVGAIIAITADQTAGQDNHSKDPCVGEGVWVKCHHLSRKGEGVCGSLGPRWEGPYVITKRISPSIYEVRKGKKTQRVHRSQLLTRLRRGNTKEDSQRRNGSEEESAISPRRTGQGSGQHWSRALEKEPGRNTGGRGGGISQRGGGEVPRRAMDEEARKRRSPPRKTPTTGDKLGAPEGERKRAHPSKTKDPTCGLGRGGRQDTSEGKGPTGQPSEDGPNPGTDRATTEGHRPEGGQGHPDKDTERGREDGSSANKASEGKGPTGQPSEDGPNPGTDRATTEGHRPEGGQGHPDKDTERGREDGSSANKAEGAQGRSRPESREGTTSAHRRNRWSAQGRASSQEGSQEAGGRRTCERGDVGSPNLCWNSFTGWYGDTYGGGQRGTPNERTGPAGPPDPSEEDILQVYPDTEKIRLGAGKAQRNGVAPSGPSPTEKCGIRGEDNADGIKE